MNVDRIGLMGKTTVLHTGIARAVRARTTTTVRADMGTTVTGGITVAARLTVIIVKVAVMAIIVPLMETTAMVVITAAARLMAITARHTGTEEGNTIVRLVPIMMTRPERPIPRVPPARVRLRRA